MLSVDNDYGRGAIAFSKKYLPQFQGQILSEDYYKDDETDFRPVLSHIKSLNVQGVLMYGLARHPRLIVRQILEVGMAGKITLLGNGEFTYPATIKVAPSVLNGAVEAAAWSPDLDNPRSLKFVDDYRDAFGSKEVPNVHSYTHWEAVYLLAASVKAAGSTDPSALRAALEAIDYQGATGEVRFDSHHQAELPDVHLRGGWRQGRPERRLHRQSRLPGLSSTVPRRKGRAMLTDVVVDGITAGSVYALVAVGMTIIFGVLRAINFAHGEFYMLGTFAAWWGIETYDLPYIVSIPLALVVVAVIALAIGFLVMRRLIDQPFQIGRHRRHAGRVTGAAKRRHPGLRRRLQDVRRRLDRAGGIHGRQPVGATRPDRHSRLVMFGALELIVHRTRFGKTMRAVAQNIEACKVVGVDVPRS